MSQPALGISKQDIKSKPELKETMALMSLDMGKNTVYICPSTHIFAVTMGYTLHIPPEVL